MAKVYTIKDYVSPEECNVCGQGFDAMNEAMDTYKEDCEAWIRANMHNEPETGKIIRFQVADGYAEYMIASLKDAVLVHLEHMDAYSFQYAHLLGTKEIKQELDRAEAWAKIINK